MSEEIPTRKKRQVHPNKRGPKFTAAQAKLQENRLQALELRKAGASYPQIAKQMNLSTPMVAWRYVQAALKDIIPEETKNEARRVMLEAIDADLARLNNLQPKTISDMVKIVTARDRLRDSKARILGVHAPTRTELTGKDGAALSLTLSDIQGMSDEQLERVFSSGANGRSSSGGGGTGEAEEAPSTPGAPH